MSRLCRVLVLPARLLSPHDAIAQQDQGSRHAEAPQMLAPIYAWFTEGFDSADLTDAATLLEELGV